MIAPQSPADMTVVRPVAMFAHMLMFAREECLWLMSAGQIRIFRERESRVLLLFHERTYTYSYPMLKEWHMQIPLNTDSRIPAYSMPASLASNNLLSPFHRKTNWNWDLLALFQQLQTLVLTTKPSKANSRCLTNWKWEQNENQEILSKAVWLDSGQQSRLV